MTFKWKLFIGLCSLVLCIIYSIGGSAAPKKIELKATALPPKYLGADIEKIYDFVVNAPYKGEFETTDEYRHELNRYWQRPIGTLWHAYDLLPISSRQYTEGQVDNITTGHSGDYQLEGTPVLRTGTIRPIVAEYNADLKRMKVTLLFSSVRTNSEQIVTSVIVRRDVIVMPSYTGENIFGAKVSVKSYEEYYYGIGEHGQKIESTNSVFPGVSIYTKVDNDKAKKFSNDVAALVFLKLDPSSRMSYISDRQHKPSIKEPYEVKESTALVTAKIKAIWFYRFSTGHIIKKIEY